MHDLRRRKQKKCIVYTYIVVTLRAKNTVRSVCSDRHYDIYKYIIYYYSTIKDFIYFVSALARTTYRMRPGVIRYTSFRSFASASAIKFRVAND
jgi:hypothetical protein